jgi:hypothetical protein
MIVKITRSGLPTMTQRRLSIWLCLGVQYLNLWLLLSVDHLDTWQFVNGKRTNLFSDPTLVNLWKEMKESINWYTKNDLLRPLLRVFFWDAEANLDLSPLMKRVCSDSVVPESGRGWGSGHVKDWNEIWYVRLATSLFCYSVNNSFNGNKDVCSV